MNTIANILLLIMLCFLIYVLIVFFKNPTISLSDWESNSIGSPPLTFKTPQKLTETHFEVDPITSSEIVEKEYLSLNMGRFKVYAIAIKYNVTTSLNYLNEMIINNLISAGGREVNVLNKPIKRSGRSGIFIMGTFKMRGWNIDCRSIVLEEGTTRWGVVVTYVHDKKFENKEKAASKILASVNIVS